MTFNTLLSVEEMYKADAAAEAAGVASLDLMEAAGAAIAAEIEQRWEKRPVAVLCGPGNNGGDGFVVARLLEAAGWQVSVALLGERGGLKGDAAVNAELWKGEVEALSPAALDDDPLVVDALFGAGLDRSLDGSALEVVEAINRHRLDCVAVDMPSGVHGDSGEILGEAPFTRLTVTFFRAKPGHVLIPGRVRCGDLVVADIGIPDAVLDDIRPATFVNGPALWLDNYPWPAIDAHKYSRGYAVIVGGRAMTGAARLAARGARRIGAGLLTIAAPPGTFAIYAGDQAGALVKTVEGADDFHDFIEDPRINAVLIGPGAGRNDLTQACVFFALNAKKTVVLDADALSIFGDDSDALFEAIEGPCLLTPHEGEFVRLFSTEGGKLERARAAAERSGATVLLKGPDTVIAEPGGRAVVNASGSPDLASGGTGDVLAGMALGLMAQGMAPFEAGSAAAWIHGAAAEAVGPGLIAEDLPEALPAVLRGLLDESGG